MESPPSPKTDLRPLPEEQEQEQQKQRTQPPVSKRRKVEHKVVITVRAEENSGKAKADGPPSDLWSWRKYGQKPIKGSPYPRGYYRCSTSKGCSAKKQVERCRTDASLLIITYTSSHNHAGPDLDQIGSAAAAAMEYGHLDYVEREKAPPPSSNSGHDSRHPEGSNTQQSSCSATAAGDEVSENCNADVASEPNLNDDHTEAGSGLHQVRCSVAGGGDKVQDTCDTEVSPDNTNASRSHTGLHLHQMSCSPAPAEDDVLAGCKREGSSSPTSTDMSGGSEGEGKVSRNLDSEEAICSKPFTAPPICEAELPDCEERHHQQKEPPKPPLSPLKHSPDGMVTVEKATDAKSNRTPQHSEEVPFHQGSVVLSSAQSGLSPEEFDFYDELEELPTISPWTSILMGTFFDERILLPS